MRVKITKTIDVHQIPSEARRTLDQLKNSLMYDMPDSMSQVIRHSLSSQGEEFFHAIELIDSFRQDLATFDESLQEVQNILSGYKKAMTPDPPIETEIQEEEQVTQEWIDNREAEYEKLMSQIDGTDEVDDEEG